MKERSIPFNAYMVRAQRAGIKTQTRRLVKPQPPAGHNFAGFTSHSTCTADEGKAVWAEGDVSVMLFNAHRVRCPYGAPGDRLWGREAYRFVLGYDPQPPRDVPDSTPVRYEADGLGAEPTDGWRWGKCRPGMFMPRWASRILLDVTEVRVQRLQDISREDAIAEGIAYHPNFQGYCLPEGQHFHSDDPRISYWSLWDAINGEGSTEKNPWIWAVSFKDATA